MRRGLFSRLGRDERGVSAVEFAMLAPVLIGFYFGMAEFCQGFMAQKRMGHVTSMVADLVARAVLIASKAPLSIRAVKAVVRTGAVLPLDEAMELELAEYNRLFTTEDRREGVTAFNQKRPAVFRGV